ncbi:MAG: membrane dipeptidase [Candidatus Solibacter usitatus]|nr:membrane dipeptidase [Candidatus Solibacter usitatus]
MRRLATLAVWLLLPASAQEDLARRIHAGVLGIDTHIDTVQRVLFEGVDLSRRGDRGHVDFPRLREGGMNAPFFALWVPTYYQGAEAVRRTLEFRDAMQRVLDAHPDQIELALNAADIERITRAGRIAAMLSVEGGHQIADSLGVLRMYYRLGIRSMTLSHFRNNNWADSSTDKPAHNGLTEFGKEVVREMNRLGMIVDISHVADKTFYDALAVTTRPAIASHSSCRAISDVPRNMTDDMIRALARNGGVIGINFGEGFINPKDAEALRKAVQSIGYGEAPAAGKALDDYAARQHRRMAGEALKVAATVEDVAAHIDHVVKIAGIDHVGIGSDFDGITGPPQGLEDVSKMPSLTAALLRKGYREADVRKVLGGNFLRVIREVTR